MNFLKNLFGKQKPKETEVQPEEKSANNVRLHFLLGIYGQNRSQENYLNVYNELYNGNSYLMIPSSNNGRKDASWRVIETGKYWSS